MEGNCLEECGEERHPQINIRDQPQGGTWLTMTKKVPRWIRVLKRIGFVNVSESQSLTFENKQIFPENAHSQLCDQHCFANQEYMLQLRIDNNPEYLIKSQTLHISAQTNSTQNNSRKNSSRHTAGAKHC